jgi:RNA polymerase sigma factor (sigma-70 family)
MSNSSAPPLVRHLRRVAALSQAGECSDGLLLERFRASRDETAFELLVRAHGPMVLGVCRRLLGHEQDAEDAFQATFLILARKAAAIRQAPSLASWLYGVAYRTAREARLMRTRRQRNEMQVQAVPEPAAPQHPDVSDLRSALDRELSRLAEKYRAAIVLCDLEGQSRSEAARQLGIPEGTLSSRLAAGRQKLAQRLRRRGLMLSAAALATAMGECATGAAIAAPLLRGTVANAIGSAAGISTNVLTLMHGVLKVMFISKLKVLGIVACPVFAATMLLSMRGPSADAAPDSAPAAVIGGAAQIGEGVKEAALSLVAAAAADDGKSVKAARPVVVKTVPQAGSDDVDPNLKEIRVTFSKDMTDKSWSWSGADEGDFPNSDGEPSYDKDNRTCVMPVKLEPGKTYALWLNSERFHNFKDADGRSAVPYLLVFETKKK